MQTYFISSAVWKLVSIIAIDSPNLSLYKSATSDVSLSLPPKIYLVCDKKSNVADLSVRNSGLNTILNFGNLLWISSQVPGTTVDRTRTTGLLSFNASSISEIHA